MIKFYEFPSTDTLVVHDVEKGIYAPFTLSLIEDTDLNEWWKSGDPCVSEFAHLPFTSIEDLEKGYA